jgi:hypothetical protein
MNKAFTTAIRVGHAHETHLRPESSAAKALLGDFSTGGTLKRVGILDTIHLNRSRYCINELCLDPFLIEIGCSSLAG